MTSTTKRIAIVSLAVIALASLGAAIYTNDSQFLTVVTAIVTPLALVLQSEVDRSKARDASGSQRDITKKVQA